METPGVRRQLQPGAVATAGPPSSQQASHPPATHTGVQARLPLPARSHRAPWVLPWESTHEHGAGSHTALPAPRSPWPLR